ncbi:MBL fold metallo-hydrolase [Pontivivens nitratireducens]|uniref:MBL fold metallo-hydrolase n=1 Tax=Pontivivens nitratireducens TaxID=2758038 RepID=UPI00163A4203|nr:MBL fold metallo-hydrolase [Pontibrevibacter nitratireducens]
MDRRKFLITSAALSGATFLPFGAFAEAHSSPFSFDTDGGPIQVHPINHASFVMEVPGMVIYVDPVGEPALYADKPAPDLILITHHHGDHFDMATLRGVATPKTVFITNQVVYDGLEEFQTRAEVMDNGDVTLAGEYDIFAIPAYNMTEDRLEYHPEGRDNGYILDIFGTRVYIAGDTEDTPEMRALQDIDIAFLPMNLPYTMDIDAAADAVMAFSPTYVFPYHYGESDIDAFTAMVGDHANVLRGNWYG